MKEYEYTCLGGGEENISGSKGFCAYDDLYSFYESQNTSRAPFFICKRLIRPIRGGQRPLE